MPTQSAARPARAPQERATTSRTDKRPTPGLRLKTNPAPVQRGARLLALLASLIIVLVLLVVVAGQAMVASQQVRLDNLHADLSAAVSSNENLQLSRAQLEAPGRILILAQKDLHMVVPKSVTYLNPVNPGPSLKTVRNKSN